MTEPASDKRIRAFEIAIEDGQRNFGCEEVEDLIARIRQAEAERDAANIRAGAFKDCLKQAEEDLDAARARIKVMDEALSWYDTNVALCKWHGEAAIDARLVLIRDGGARARAARKELTDDKT
jgi:hypothetical protein